MRIADSLTLPPELERARAAGDLVVFAGAGVSMGPPACLPSFKGLARQIAEPRFPWNNSYENSLDRYLGRAEREGVKVQDRARMFLNTGGSHTPLHEHLLGIFGTSGRVRLITTNFDHHFSTAAESVFPGALIPYYVGPALPPGRHFSGIAQLHGALDHPQDKLVLTDSDFADAYMAEGWAARFLVRVFADRTVLFVGYSLGDPLMQYLLHALPSTGQWYALWHESEISQGAEHPISAVPFRTTASGDKFGDLNDGMQRWHWYVGASASDHDRELRRLITLGPPASPLDADYVRARLLTDAGRKLFWTTATDQPWFEWVATEGFIDGLTDGRGTDLTTPLWGRWCLDNFCSGDTPPLLHFLRGRPLTLQPWFLSELVRYLWCCKSLPPRPVLRHLIALIVSQPKPLDGYTHDWEWLLQRLVSEHCYEETLSILAAATRVHLQPIERMYLAFESDKEKNELPPFSIRVGTAVSAAELDHFLREHGADLATATPEYVLLLGERRIQEAYDLLAGARGATESIDWLSYGRTSIAPSNQDNQSHAEDILVSLVRLVLDHFATAGPDRLQSFAVRHEQSAHKLLRRLSLYAYAKCSDCSADEILTRASAQGWARDYWVRPEFYLVLTTHFSQASEKARRDFVDTLRNDRWWGEVFDEHSAHARYSLSMKLLREAPESTVAQSFAAEESAEHPEWGEGDPDGYLSRMTVGSGGEGPSPIESNQMLGWSPPEALQRLGDELQQLNEHDRGYSLLGAVQQAVRSNSDWGAKLAVLAMNGDAAFLRIANAALWGLRDSCTSTPARVELLRNVIAAGWAHELTGALSSLLDKWSEGLGMTADSVLLDSLDRAADLVYDRSTTERAGIEGHGWTESAINHPAGHAANVWWRVASARDWVDGQFVLSIDDTEKARWARVSRDDTAAGAFARPILGMATERLSSGDFPWTVDVIFPMFDPTSGAERAAQLWDGRLMQHRWSASTLEGLRPYFDALFEACATMMPKRSEQIGDWVAFLVADSEKSPFVLSQLQRFVQHATPEARRAFARGLPQHLARLEPDDRRRLWHDMLSLYWRDRRTNMPLALETDEVREMISWILALPEVAAEALTELRLSPGEGIEHADHVIWQWKEDDSWVRAHPTEAAGIVEFLATRRSISAWEAEDAVAVLGRALDAGAPRDGVLLAAESLVAMSSRGAVALVERIRSTG